jgi:hypothetical protein
MPVCQLCGKDRELCDSHIIPSFVFSWLKKTAATGYLRNANNINKRIQDGIKQKLLCHDCEELFSNWEKQFAEKIFTPYVAKELDDFGRAKGIIQSFQYDEWLLKFIISVQWRILIVDDGKIENKDDLHIQKEMGEYREILKDYLLNKRLDTGKTQSHLLFFQSFTNVEGNISKEIPDTIDSYILRTSDATIVMKNRKWGVYAKFGPIIAFTTINNWQLKKMIGTRVRRKGIITTKQSIFDPDISAFIIRERPKEINNSVHNYSQKQLNILERDYNKHSSDNSLTKAVIDNRTIVHNKKCD